MTNTCQACARKCDSGLCGECQRTLRNALRELPWWLARLSEAAVGQVKLGDGGRGSSRREPFKGDDEVSEGDSTMLRKFLAAGRVNARASDLFDEIVNALGTTIRDLCETRGVEVPDLQTPARMALWLAGSVSAVAMGECAGETYSELYGLSGRIERIINRPIPPRLVGPCPSSVDYGHDPDCKARHPHVCGNRLMARREAIEVTCRQCGRTHNVEYLVNRLINDAGHMRFTVAEIHQLVERVGEHLPVRTFQHWRKSHDGKPPRIKIAGYRSADGRRITISRHAPEDVPLYRLDDVRRAMDERRVKA